jgi:hypothetical protein
MKKNHMLNAKVMLGPSHKFHHSSGNRAGYGYDNHGNGGSTILGHPDHP